jgi:hypothetical protein
MGVWVKVSVEEAEAHDYEWGLCMCGGYENDSRVIS